MHADLILLNARIHTFNPKFSQAEALAVAEGKVVWVGGNSQAGGYKGTASRVIDLDEKTVFPGFVDAHQHQLYMGLSYRQIDASPGSAESISDIISQIQERADELPAGSWIEGHGYHDARLTERRNPNRFDLDRAAPDHPVLISRTCGHVLAVNSRALELAGIDSNTPDPSGGTIDRDEATGEPTGVVRESAMALVRRALPTPDQARLREAILAASKTNLRHGITSVWEPSIEPDHLRAYRDLESDGALPLQVTMAHKQVLRSGEEVELPAPFRFNRLSLVAIKLFQDGGFGAATAALTDPYTNAPDTQGQLIWSQDELDARATQICEADLRISIHAIGDAAIRSALKAISAAAAIFPQSGPHRIEHCGLPLPPLPEALTNHGIVPVLQPVFIWFDGDVYLDRVGPERGRWLYPVRSLLESGLTVAGSSDGPVVADINPLLGAFTAVARRSQSGRLVAPEEAVTLDQALRLYTTFAAHACGEGQHRGSLEPGKAADFTILGEDPYSVSLESLPDIPVERVFVGGEEADLT